MQSGICVECWKQGFGLMEEHFPIHPPRAAFTSITPSNASCSNSERLGSRHRSAECLALRMSHSPLADFAFGCLNWRMAPPDLLWARNPSHTQIRLDTHGRMIHADATMQTANWLFCADSCCFAFLSLPKAASPQPNGPSPPKPRCEANTFLRSGSESTTDRSSLPERSMQNLRQHLDFCG